MISDLLNMVIIGLLVVLVVYPTSHLVRQTWAARQRRPRLEGPAVKRRS